MLEFYSVYNNINYRYTKKKKKMKRNQESTRRKLVTIHTLMWEKIIISNQTI